MQKFHYNNKVHLTSKILQMTVIIINGAYHILQKQQNTHLNIHKTAIYSPSQIYVAVLPDTVYSRQSIKIERTNDKMKDRQQRGALNMSVSTP